MATIQFDIADPGPGSGWTVTVPGSGSSSAAAPAPDVRAAHPHALVLALTAPVQDRVRPTTARWACHDAAGEDRFGS